MDLSRDYIWLFGACCVVILGAVAAMIPYLNTLPGYMYYLDVHTHQSTIDPVVEAIVSTLVQPTRKELSVASYRSFGIHPCRIEEDGEVQWNILRQYVEQPSCVAIGEAGLDRLATCSMERQISLFDRQARLAEEVGKPLIIHCVRAWEELIACRKAIRPKQPWLIHGFRGKAPLAGQLLRQGFYLSLGYHFQPEAARLAWPDRLFLETDEAAVSIQVVYGRVAEALSIDLQALCDQIQRNSVILRLKNTTFAADYPQ